MKSSKQNSYLRKLVIAAAVVAIELLISAPAWAHHPLDGRLPANFMEGLMSGFGHPVIGLDHLAFVIASGLMAVVAAVGAAIPFAFILATGIGTGIHLVSIDLPIPEIIIAVSVVLFGVLLALDKKHKTNNYGLMAIALGTHFVVGKIARVTSIKYLTRFAGTAIASCGIIFLSAAVMG